MQWAQERMGCIAVAKFLGRAPSANAASSAALPPPPPPPPRTPPPQDAPTTFKAQGAKLDAQQRTDLGRLAKERDEQRS